MGLVKPEWLGWSPSLNYLRLDLPSHLHPRHLPPVWQGQLQDWLDIMLLSKHTCSIGHACNLRCSLYNSLICDSRTLIRGRELKGMTWFCYCEV